MEPFEMNYKIYLEADDIGQSRIHECTAFLKNCLDHSGNCYVRDAAYDDESDLDAFTLRFYVEKELREASCTAPEDAQDFVLDLAKILDSAAAAHSFMDLEGEFSWSFCGEKKRYTFRSPGGSDVCEFTKEQ